MPYQLLLAWSSDKLMLVSLCLQRLLHSISKDKKDTCKKTSQIHEDIPTRLSLRCFTVILSPRLLAEHQDQIREDQNFANRIIVSASQARRN